MAVYEDGMDADWPMLDFSLFPNETISGLSLSEINEVMSASEAILANDVSPGITTTNFAAPISDETVSLRVMANTPQSTRNRDKWSLNVYEKWHKQRPVTSGDADIPLPSRYELKSADQSSVDYWLSKFILEIRKKDGSRYPRNTLISLVAGMNSYLAPLNLFKDEVFHNFRTALDISCKESTEAGAGLNKKQAEVITEAEEEKLWNSGQLGDDTPMKLINTLVYLNGLHFALRSGKEHRDLTLDKVKVIPANENCEFYCVEYTEKLSKTNGGGFKHRKVEPKHVKHVDVNSKENPARSHALLIEKYICLRQQLTNKNVFYLTPLKGDVMDNEPWFKDVPMGHNMLQNIVKKMCQSCGISGRKTNHSLRATCATRLYQNGVDEQLIMMRTGHRSEKGVRVYKRTQEIHHHDTSFIIDNSSKKHISTGQASNQTACQFHFHSGCNVVIKNCVHENV